MQEYIKLAKNLISIPSTKDQKDNLQSVLKECKKWLKKSSTIEYFNEHNRPNLLIYNSANRPKKFKIILNAHLDVVEAEEHQFIPKIVGKKLIGRGAQDMKAAAAVQIVLLSELSEKLNYPLALQLVTDEEIGGFDGTKHQIDKGVRGEFVIAGEPTDLAINNQAKGIIWMKIRIKGKSAHGAYPWLGENSLWKANEFLEKLKRKYPTPKKEVWKSTINLAKIDTPNQAFNKVPDECYLSLDTRYIPEDKEKITRYIKQSLPKYSDIEILLNEPCQFTSKENSFITLLSRSVKKVTGKTPPIITKHGGSDIRHYNAVHCDGITFGPTGSGMHTENEWVDISSLGNYYHTLKDFLLSLN